MAEEQEIISYDPATTNMVLDRMYQNRNAFPFDTEAKPESEKGITSGAVYGALAELKGATTLNKGYWKDANSLMAGVPSAEEGSIAYVGENAPYKIYRYGASGWADTGQTHTPSVSLGDYYTKKEVDGMLSVLKDEIGQISLTIGEIIRRLERLEAGGGVGPGTGSRVVGDILYLADGIAHSAEGMLTFIGGAAYSEEKLTINR